MSGNWWDAAPLASEEGTGSSGAAPAGNWWDAAPLADETRVQPGGARDAGGRRPLRAEQVDNPFHDTEVPTAPPVEVRAKADRPAAEVAPLTVGSAARDVASGVLQIGPTAVKGLADLARLATGDRLGKGLSDSMEQGMRSIREVVGSDRAAQQRQKFEQDMADPNVGIADTLLENKGALADQVLPTIGSMFVPVGAAGAAAKVAQAGKAAQAARAAGDAAMLARVNRAREAGAIGAMVAQNAADTYSTIRDQGGDQGDAYKGAAITAPFTAVAGKLTGGAAEAQAAKFLSRQAAVGAAEKGAMAIPRAMVKEGAQEMAEEVGQYLGESEGTGTPLDALTAGKRLAVAGTLGAAMGGGVNAAGQLSRAAADADPEKLEVVSDWSQIDPSGTVAPSADGAAAVDNIERILDERAVPVPAAAPAVAPADRIQQLRDAGEEAAADLLQRRADSQAAEQELETLAGAAGIPAVPDFADGYRALRAGGMKPAEAAARSAMTSSFAEAALPAGLSEKAIAAARAAAQEIPLDKLPGFYQRFAAGMLESQGAAVPDLAAGLEAARDQAMETVIGSIYDASPEGDSPLSSMRHIQEIEARSMPDTGVATVVPSAEEFNVQDAAPGTPAQADAPTGQAGAADPGQPAVPAAGLPAAGSADLETAGVVNEDPADEAAAPQSRSAQIDSDAFKAWYGDWSNGVDLQHDERAPIRSIASAGADSAGPAEDPLAEPSESATTAEPALGRSGRVHATDVGAGAGSEFGDPSGAGALEGWTDDPEALDRLGAKVPEPAGVAQGGGVRTDATVPTFTGRSGPVDSQGRPAVYFHGSRDDIAAFDLNHPGRKDQGWLGTGVYLASDPEAAHSYAERKRGSAAQNVMPLYANVRNPYVATAQDRDTLRRASRQQVDAFTRDLQVAGYDGVAYNHPEGWQELLVFEPNNVKSATGNRGTFDPASTDIRQSRGSAASGRTGHVQAVVDGIRMGWKNAPQIVVVPDMQDPAVPQRLREQDALQKSQGAEGEVEGFVYGGKVYLVADAIADDARAATVLLHEALGHYGLRGTFGESLRPILANLVTLRRADVLAKVQQYGLDPAQQRHLEYAAEEVLAEMAQEKPHLRLVQRAVAAIRSWLRESVAAFRDLEVTDAEIIRDFILPARAYVERAARPAVTGGAGAVAFSRSAMKSVEANIARGHTALARALDEKSTVHRAMFRSGMGWVDFVWGDVGVVRPNGKTKKAMGLSHILEARQRKDGLTEREAVESLGRIVSTIAQGREAERNTMNQSVAVKIEHDGYRVGLTKNPGSNAWVVTGFELGQVRGRPDIDARPPTQALPTLPREELGADPVAPGDTVPSLDRATRRDSTERGSPAGAGDGASIAQPKGGSKLDEKVSATGTSGAASQETGKLGDQPAAADESSVSGLGDVPLSRSMGSAKAGSSHSAWKDEVDRLQFAPGAWLFDKLGAAATPLLNRLQMKAASPELRRQLRAMKLDISKAQETAAAVAVESQKLSQAERDMVSDLIEQELKAGTVPPAHAVKLADVINRTMGAQTDELVRLGMLTKDSADRWKGRYLPRYYRSKLKPPTLDAWADALKTLMGRTSAMKGVKGKHLKGRGLFEVVPAAEVANYEALGWEIRDLDFDPAVDETVQMWRDFTPEEREKMGEIRDAGFRFVMGYMQTQRDIALGKMFEGIAGNDKLAARLQSEAFSVRVPDTTVDGTGAKRYGKLAGLFVTPEVMSQLSSVEESQSAAWRMYRQALAVWKEGKTVLNPVSHVNNIVSNLTMAHFAGIGYHRVDKYLAASRDLVRRSPMLKEAKDNGLFLGTLSDAELLQGMPEELKTLAMKQDSALEKGARGVYNIVALGLRKPAGAAYQFEDTFFRYLVYREARQRGMEPTDAVDYAQKFIFSYDDLPRGARMIRDFGLPFFSYTYKAVPALLQTALTHPDRLAAPAAVLWAVNAAAYAIAAGDDDDSWWETLQRYLKDADFREKVRKQEQLEREHLPPWQKGTTALMTPKVVRLGMDEVTKLPLFIDMSRFIPGGDLFDVSPNAGGIPLPQPITPSHPLLTTAVAMLGNRDLFLGRDLVDMDDTRGEAAAKRGQWLWQQFAPASTVGNYHAERAMQALAQASGGEIKWLPEVLSDRYTGIGRDGMPVQPGRAAMQTFGIKVRPVDLDKAEEMEDSQRNKLMRNIEAEMRSLGRLNDLGAISDRAYDKAKARADLKLDRLDEGLTVDGDKKE